MERVRRALAIDPGAFLRAVIFVAPILVLSLSSGCESWLQAALVGLSALLGRERSGLALPGMVLHGLAILAGYLLLSFALWQPVVFVASCTVIAAAAIRLDALGRKLRALGTFTFIPSLYLACEIGNGCRGVGGLSSAAECILAPVPQMAATVALAVLLAGLGCAYQRRGAVRSSFVLARPANFGARTQNGAAVLAATVSVAITAAFVEWRGLPSGQWAIWSAASIVTAEAGAAHRKLGLRVLGASVGVPTGLALACAVPHAAWASDIAILGSALTLFAFKDYLTALTLRYGLTALAVALSGQTAALAAERIVNVSLGGAIGLACVASVGWIGEALRGAGDQAEDGLGTQPSSDSSLVGTADVAAFAQSCAVKKK
ncbi:FUSC family protein [Bradyrhizobium erythrophlei]|uniref:FUSC family protein n=1 Tax=Bradyrhizobium erythrophlei TaxID=1437360 RepID=UPI0035E732D4